MKFRLIVVGVTAFAFTTAGVAKPNNGRGGQAKEHSAKSKDRSEFRIDGQRPGRLFALDGNCPPGLAKRDNGCLPPGQAKKVYDVGERYNRNFGTVWSYDQLPLDLRQQYQLDADDRYYYRQGHVYQVDPTTMIVQQVVSALLK